MLDFKEDPLAQIIVPCNNLVSYLCIIYYLAGINFIQSLVLRQKVVVAALAKIAFEE